MELEAMAKLTNVLFAAVILSASLPGHAGGASGPGNGVGESAPGAAENGPGSVGASTGSDGHPRVQKINQYALKSTSVIRQLLSDAKAL